MLLFRYPTVSLRWWKNVIRQPPSLALFYGENARAEKADHPRHFVQIGRTPRTHIFVLYGQHNFEKRLSFENLLRKSAYAKSDYHAVCAETKEKGSENVYH